MSFSEIVIEVRDLSKCYHIYNTPQDRLKQFLWRGKKKYYSEFWALKPISFEVKKGECVGFIGRNGSGKSSLLQILAGTLNPTAGVCNVIGRVAALLELGAGFNPEFSGRENVYLNAAILGLSREEIERKFSAIEEFAEIGLFIDQPVKTYSSGMYVRLAFAVAIHVEPDLLIVDEALSVGDAAFQYKCLRKIEELKTSGMSILFVSHDVAAIKRFCSRAGWLNNGELVAIGDSVSVSNQYEDFLRAKMPVEESVPNAEKSSKKVTKNVREEAPQAKILDAQLFDENNRNCDVFKLGNTMKLHITYEVTSSPPDGLVIGGAIFRSDELYVCGLNTGLDNFRVESSEGVHTVELSYPNIELIAGSYTFKMGVFDSSHLVTWDFRSAMCPFTITSDYVAEGVVCLDHQWAQVQTEKARVAR